MRVLAFLLFFLAAIAGAVWLYAGRADGPVIEITGSPVIGQIGEVTVTLETPGGQLKSLAVHLEQDGETTELFESTPRRGFVDTVELDPARPAPAAGTALVRLGPDQLQLTAPIGKRAISTLEAGSARIVVKAVRPVLFELREALSSATREVEVRLSPPRLAALSRYHFINHGGSEMVVYRVTPPEAASGVRVGEHEYPGFPGSGAGIPGDDPGLRVAFFALLPDQDVDTPIRLYGRDAVGNEGIANFETRVFPKEFRTSRINLSDRFLERVVPAILQHETELEVADPNDLLASYLVINRDLRRINNEQIAALADRTAPEILWQGRFKQFMNSAVEAGFADRRTYVYNGRDVDQQVHLGFDLASTAAAPVQAANRGRVLHAGWLGIYGNCVILDHGMGLQSLYAHLSTIAVEPGELVEKDGVLGRSGSTGLAGGDHLHFTMLLGGQPVTAIDWWSEKWLEDRVMRKRFEAGMPSE